MYLRGSLVLPTALLLIVGVSCGKPQVNQGGGVTYYKNVKPIFAANCEGCHSPNNIGPFDITTYAGAKANAAVIASATQARIMPPWMPSSDSLPFVHERRLSDADIQTIQAWVSQGAQEGNPADTPALPPAAPTIHVDAQLKVPLPYTPDLSLGTDDYRCFVLDPQLTTQQAVTAFNIMPGDARIVHHVILYSVPKSDQAKLQTLEDEDPTEGYTCFGDARIGDAKMVGGWVPGTTATAFPDGTGVYLDAGSVIVMQVHYNTLQTKDGMDQTTAQLQFAPPATVTQAYIFPILNNSFYVAPGDTAKVVKTLDTSALNIPAGISLKVYGVLPHMHLHGTAIEVTDDTVDGQHLVAVHIPKWDFHWQQFYFYQDPFDVQKGDKITLECDYDNTAANQPIINGQQVPPQPLTWGEGTLQEMCLNFFYATIE